MATDEYWLSAFYSHQGQEKPDQPDNSWFPPYGGFDFGSSGGFPSGGYWAMPGGSWGDLVDVPTWVAVDWAGRETISLDLGAVNWTTSNPDPVYSRFLGRNPDYSLGDPRFWTEVYRPNAASLTGRVVGVDWLPEGLAGYSFEATSIYPDYLWVTMYSGVEWTHTWATDIGSTGSWFGVQTNEPEPLGHLSPGYTYQIQTPKAPNLNHFAIWVDVKKVSGAGEPSSWNIVGAGQAVLARVQIGWGQFDARTGVTEYAPGSMTGQGAVLVQRKRT